MTKKVIAVLPGDGIGPEVTTQAVQVLKAAGDVFGHDFKFREALVGAAAIDEMNDPFPGVTEEICRSSDAILFGAIGDPKYDNDPSAKVRPEQGLLAMRKKLGLFANVRPVQSYKSLEDKSPLKNEIVRGTDFVVFRELTGGIYFGEPRGRNEQGTAAFDTCTYTVEEIERIAHRAFQAAGSRKKHLTLVDKANVLATSRLWRETVKRLASDYPDVELDFMFVDNAAMKIITNPSFFDVVLTENMFGDILTDEASVLSGSLGMLPSASMGDKYALYEPIHGSYPEAAGKNKANPFGAILSAAMLLEYSFGMIEESKCIREAVDETMQKGIVTEDIESGSAYGTTDVGNAVVAAINSYVSVKT